jgi:hypothetical protein
VARVLPRRTVPAFFLGTARTRFGSVLGEMGVRRSGFPPGDAAPAPVPHFCPGLIPQWGDLGENFLSLSRYFSSSVAQQRSYAWCGAHSPSLRAIESGQHTLWRPTKICGHSNRPATRRADAPCFGSSSSPSCRASCRSSGAGDPGCFRRPRPAPCLPARRPLAPKAAKSRLPPVELRCQGRARRLRLCRPETRTEARSLARQRGCCGACEWSRFEHGARVRSDPFGSESVVVILERARNRFLTVRARQGRPHVALAARHRKAQAEVEG